MSQQEKYQKKTLQDETWNDLYGYKYSNLPYDINDCIPNTFKKTGENYNPDVGNVNDGQDYEKNDKNFYDLYIPYSAIQEKDKTPGIFLFFHGLGDTKEHVEWLCSRYTKCGYITATIETTGIGINKDQTIFRSLDEIIVCFQSIKRKLLELKLNIDNLEAAVGGVSAGGYTALLYGYIIGKNSPIPIKFIINYVAQATMEPFGWYSFKNKEDSLENLERETIEKAIKEGILIPSNENEMIYLIYMNLFLGGLYTQEQFKSMVNEQGKIIRNHPDYIKFLKIAKNCFPLYSINKNSVPTLNIYGGKDIGVSVVQCMHLIEKLKENNVPHQLIYMRYGGHDLDDNKTENGLEAMRKIHYYILSYAKKYFNQ